VLFLQCLTLDCSPLQVAEHSDQLDHAVHSCGEGDGVDTGGPGLVVGAIVVHGNVLHATLSNSTSPLHVLHLSEMPPPHDFEHIVYADHSPHTRSHCWVLHATVSFWKKVKPSSLVHCLTCIICPPPQVAEHSVHGPHSLQKIFGSQGCVLQS